MSPLVPPTPYVSFPPVVLHEMLISSACVPFLGLQALEIDVVHDIPVKVMPANEATYFKPPEVRMPQVGVGFPLCYGPGGGGERGGTLRFKVEIERGLV